MVIAYDFDGTLVEDKYPEIGKPLMGYTYNRTMIDEAILLRKNGHKIILWTCRNGALLEEAVNFCKSQGLEFDAINDDLEEHKQMWKDELIDWKKSGKARKIFADIYIDDRGLGTYLVKNLNNLLNLFYGVE